MKAFIYKNRVLWISLIVSALIVLSMDSCSGTRAATGCMSEHFSGYR